MSINTDDLRSVGGQLGERAADEIEGLEQELADSNKAYELLFIANGNLQRKYDAAIETLTWVANSPHEDAYWILQVQEAVANKDAK